MALHVLEDLAFTFSGDLVLDTRGDVQLSDPLETVKSAANYLLRTDHGDYAPNPAMGANLGSLIGESMTVELQETAEAMINQTLANNLLTKTDVRSTVVPADWDVLACFVDIYGTYLISGQLVQAQQTLSYQFPYLAGPIEPVI